MARFAPPPRWGEDELAADRAKALELFISERRARDPALWAQRFDEVRNVVEALFDASDNLLSITPAVLLAKPDLWWHVLRYCCGPPVSEEDLWTYVGGPKFKRIPEAWAADTASVFRQFIDDVRFPWVREHRQPSEAELARALDATTMPLAQQRFATAGRGEASKRQEAAVAAALAAAGFDKDDGRTPILVPDELPRGSYARERRLAGDKCDVPLRLRDGRVLAIECKSSNGPKNGWKRLIREVSGKAETWRRAFGEQVITAAVLAGVYDLSNLVGGQERGVVIFWEHDLAPLIEFAASAR